MRTVRDVSQPAPPPYRNSINIILIRILSTYFSSQCLYTCYSAKCSQLSNTMPPIYFFELFSQSGVFLGWRDKPHPAIQAFQLGHNSL